MIRAAVIGDDTVAIRLLKIADQAIVGSVAVTRTFTELLRSQIIRNASTAHHPPGAPHVPGTGPGPNIATGDYIRSWTTRVDVSLLGVEGVAATNAPQARRLEFGFVGTDALERNYDQAPFPHAGPALDTIQPKYVEALSVMIEGATRV